MFENTNDTGELLNCFRSLIYDRQMLRIFESHLTELNSDQAACLLEALQKEKLEAYSEEEKLNHIISLFQSLNQNLDEWGTLLLDLEQLRQYYHSRKIEHQLSLEGFLRKIFYLEAEDFNGVLCGSYTLNHLCILQKEIKKTPLVVSIPYSQYLLLPGIIPRQNRMS